jgi:uncharacterized protein
MAVKGACLEKIEDFLAQKRIAIVGISREPGSFSATLFKELRHRGYDVVPVNPNASEVLELNCFARVQDIQPPVDGAMLMTSPAATEEVVSDCAMAGIRRVWMFRAAGQGAVSSKAIRFCEQKGIEVIPGECPFMFLRHASAIHRLHGLIRKVTGRYPGRGQGSSRAPGAICAGQP